jgi:hypothetical protein
VGALEEKLKIVAAAADAREIEAYSQRRSYDPVSHYYFELFCANAHYFYFSPNKNECVMSCERCVM